MVVVPTEGVGLTLAFADGSANKVVIVDEPEEEEEEEEEMGDNKFGFSLDDPEHLFGDSDPTTNMKDEIEIFTIRGNELSDRVLQGIAYLLGGGG